MVPLSEGILNLFAGSKAMLVCACESRQIQGQINTIISIVSTAVGAFKAALIALKFLHIISKT
jgi:hypothetical protein